MSKDALSRAVDIVGGQKPLADIIGTTQSQVWYWLNRSKKGVAGQYAAKVEEATKGRVSCHDLRPDIFAPTSPKEQEHVG